MAPDADDRDHAILIRYLVETLPCVECGGMYGTQDITVVDEDAGSWTLVALCPHCGAESVVRAVVDNDAEEPLFEADESIAPGQWEMKAGLPPDRAEIAAWHRFLTEFDGDLRDLLRG